MPRSTSVIAAAASLPGGECEIFVAQLGGAMARVAADATAFVGRDARFIMNVHGRWSDPADDDARARLGAQASSAPPRRTRTGSGYVNFLTEDEGERVAASYGGQLPAPAGAEAPLRSGQPVPHEPQHRAGGERVDGLVAMSRVDHRGCTVSGAEPAALEAFERALAAYQGWRVGAEAPLALALQEAPALRDGARAAGLPARLQPRSAPRRAGAADARARRRAAGQRARAPARRRDRGAARRRLRRARGATLGELLRARAARRARAAGGALARLRQRRRRAA